MSIPAFGTTEDAAIVADQNGRHMGFMRGLVKMFAEGSARLAATGKTASVTDTRPNDTSAYTANDVIGPATGSTAALTFSALQGSSGGEFMITSAELEIDASALIASEGAYRLYLYNVTPPSALGDNAAWDLPSGDRTSFLGYVDLGTPVDLGSTLYVRADSVNMQISMTGPDLFGYLVTTAGYTPTAQRVYKVKLHGTPV